MFGMRSRVVQKGFVQEHMMYLHTRLPRGLHGMVGTFESRVGRLVIELQHRKGLCIPAKVLLG